MVCPPEGGAEQRNQHASQARESGGSAISVPRGSVIQQNITKLASIATRSTAASDESSLWGWLATAATQSTATQTPAPETDERSLQQWRSAQGKYWLELERLQHSIQQTLEQSRDPGRKARARSPTAVLEQLLDRIRGISQDMHALNRSCCVEMATSSAPSAARKASRGASSATRTLGFCSAEIRRVLYCRFHCSYSHFYTIVGHVIILRLSLVESLPLPHMLESLRSK